MLSTRKDGLRENKVLGTGVGFASRVSCLLPIVYSLDQFKHYLILAGRDPHELPLAMEARRLWQEVDQQVQGRTGYTQGGVHYLASTEKELENLTPVSMILYICWL